MIYNSDIVNPHPIGKLLIDSMSPTHPIWV